MQSLGMDKFRVAFTPFLAFYSDNPSGPRDGETPAKWQSKASFATHPSTEPEWPPKLAAILLFRTFWLTVYIAILIFQN